MLDTMIIDHVRREREQRRDDQRPRLYIEPPPILEPPARPDERPAEKDERGIAEIDFRI